MRTRSPAPVPPAMPSGNAPAAGQDHVARAEVDRDRARMLYAYAGPGLVMCAVSSLALVLAVRSPSSDRGLAAWLAAMLAILLIRAADVILRWPRRRGRDFVGRAQITIYAAGTMACAAVWAVFPPLFFPAIGETGRAATCVLFATLAGGRAILLGPSLTIALGSSAALLLPAALVFQSMPMRQDRFLGLLCLASFAAVAAASCLGHRSILQALRTGRAHENLSRALARTQTALNEANASLERRVGERTRELAHEIAERERYAQALARLASTDALTGLPNRATFAERLACTLDQARLEETNVAVLFFDIDDFKQVNDVRGHATGDRLLVAVAQSLQFCATLQSCASAPAELARWGGDEFLVALPGGGRPEAAAVAEALRASFAQADGADRAGISAGIAVFPKDARTPDALIRAADLAMYEAKREGKGQTRSFDPMLAWRVADHHLLERDLRHAVTRGQIRLVYQPIIDARTGACEGFEALMRWQHPERGPVSPASFIPIAEQSGQIAALSRWALGEACRVAMSWPGALSVAVNVSVAYVQSGTLIEDVEAALARSGLPPSRLHLELTESMFLGDHARTTAVFSRLRQRGLKILLDDFGTGFSCLAYLGQLPIDIIKIDRHFVSAAARDDWATIRAMLSIAHALSLEVTAEGVETELQRESLAAMGVEHLQGFHLGRPLPSDEAIADLAKVLLPA